jgi:hypothetical protein
MKRDALKLAAVLGLILVGLVLAGCGESRSPYAGTYQAVECFPDNKCIEIDLKENGKGTWTVAGKTMAEFTWVVNDGKPWFYLKSGGILIATPSEGGKVLSVDMTGDWHPGCPPNQCLVFKRVLEGGQSH